jgi:hypothetical protein
MIVNIFIGRIWLETGFIRAHLEKAKNERHEYPHENNARRDEEKSEETT